MNELVQVFNGVRGYEQDGVAYLHIEDVARGLGFTQTKDGASYIRWEAVEHHLYSLKFLSQLDGKMLDRHDYFIPENIFYRLCMKAKNETAEAFQAKVADEIIPSIRRTGRYEVKQAIPDFSNPAEAARAWADAYEAKQKAQLALEAEKEQHAKDNQEWRNGFDIVNRQKSQISTQREKTAMITASIKSRENIKLRDENEKLLDENDKLREQIGDSKNMKAVRAITWLDKYFDLKIPENKHVDKSIADKLKKICLQHSKTLQNGEIEFEEGWAIGHIDDPAYKNGLNIYPIKAIDLLERLLEERHPFTEPLNKYRYGYSKC